MKGQLGLDDLPTRNGFRLRGLEMTRIETFTDAAFAFALTLLVLSSFPPRSLPELYDALRQIPVFLFGAMMLMVFWNGHNEWSRRYGLDDTPTMVLSVALVSTILVYVYPLRFVGNLFILFLGRLTHLNIGTPPEGAFGPHDVNTVFIIYGAGFIANGVVLILLNLHAWGQREVLQLNEQERFHTQSEIGAWVILCGVGLVSILVGAVVPDMPGAPGFAYMLLPIIMPLYGMMMGRRRERIAEDRRSRMR